MHTSVRIGLISDTHGLLRPEAAEFLRGCDHIVHGGDIGRAGIIEELSAIAPVSAIRGNIDEQALWAEAVPQTRRVDLAGMTLFVLHDVRQLDIDPAAEGIDVVVSGHSHRPCIEQRDGVLYVNPGSAGPRRFKLPIAVAELCIRDGLVRPRIVELAINPV